MANVDYGQWSPTDLDRRRIDRAAELLPEGWRVRCGDANSRGNFQVTVLDVTGEALATGSFAPDEFAAVVVFLQTTARRKSAHR